MVFIKEVKDMIILGTTIDIDQDIKLQIARRNYQITRKMVISNATIATSLDIKLQIVGLSKNKENETCLIHQSKNEEILFLASHDSKVGEMSYLDNGISKHMIGNKNLFSNLSRIYHDIL